MLVVCWSVLYAPAVLGGADSVGLPSAAEGHALKARKHSQFRLTSTNKSHSWLVIWPKVEVNGEKQYSWCCVCKVAMFYKVTKKQQWWTENHWSQTDRGFLWVPQHNSSSNWWMYLFIYLRICLNTPYLCYFFPELFLYYLLITHPSVIYLNYDEWL